LLKAGPGIGVEMDMSANFKTLNSLVKSFLKPNTMSASFRICDGTLHDLNGSLSTEASAGFFIGSTWNLNESTDFSGLEFGSVGGGVYRNVHVVWIVRDVEKKKKFDKGFKQFFKELGSIINAIKSELYKNALPNQETVFARNEAEAENLADEYGKRGIIVNHITK
ncbi:hypothetical protein KAR48_06515, partial [bacterium]|nr:hypothetical protein [bacterium]